MERRVPRRAAQTMFALQAPPSPPVESLGSLSLPAGQACGAPKRSRRQPYKVAALSALIYVMVGAETFLGRPTHKR